MRRPALVLLLALLLAGCARQRWLKVESGEYTRVLGTDEASRAAARHIRSLRVDHEAATATITLDDGSQILLALVARARSEWPAGCPTNFVNYQLEVLDVEASNLTIASMTFQEPVLVRNCPGDPREIVLREDGPTGGSGSAQRDSSLVFGQVSFSTAPSLPHSEKGYELYSWREGEGAGWNYTLMTGTNRLKSSEEIIGGEDTVTEDGWVKLTETDVDDLLELLGRLPDGEQIFWHGASSSSGDADAGQFRLPDEEVVAVVQERCGALGLELAVVAGGLQAVLAIGETVVAGEPVELTFTLINQATYPLYVLKWYTPLEGIAGEIFRVVRDGQPLPYRGILAMRGDPGPESYVLLPAGGSETATVDLAQAYDFSEVGTYTIAFLSPRISHVARSEDDMAQTVEELGPVMMVSNTVSVRVVTGKR